MRLYHLLLVPVLATSMLLTVAACEDEGPSRSKDAIYTYELSGKYANGRKAEIGARYTYGSRAARLSSKSGLVKTKVTTAGPKKVIINVLADPTQKGDVTCEIVVKSGGKKIATITNKGRNSTSCRFES